MVLPSVKQMLNRSLQGHLLVLEAVATDSKLGTVASTPGEIRGYRTCIATLHRWQCIDDNGLTERGEELLALLKARKENSRRSA